MDPRNPGTEADPELDSIVQAAAHWRLRVDAGLTEAEQAELVRWKEADPRHEAVFEDMDATWGILDRMGELPEPGRVRRRGFGWWAAGLAAAAAVAVGLVTWQERGTDYRQVAAAEVGMIKRLDLPDGSVVRMNSGTEVVAEYAGGRRTVRLLRGEAHFAVAPDPEKPFVVEAGGAAVRAVGTAFNVALREDAVEVLVTAGKVTVRPPAEAGEAEGVESPVLEAGRLMVVSRQPAVAAVVEAVAPARVEQALAWRDRQLDFEAVPLAEILAEFNRYNVHQLVLAPEAEGLGREKFGGSFRADDPETFVALLRLRANVVVEPGSGRTVIRLAR